MLERDGYIPGVPCWVDTWQADPQAGIAFYRGLFGWEFEDVMPPGSPGEYHVARLRGGDVAAIGSQPEGGPEAGVWNTYIWVQDADKATARVWAAGGGVISGPRDVSDAGRMAVCSDREGARFCLWQARGHKGARIVNEPGSLNFNGLNTGNVARAKAFYGTLFGWQALDVGSGMRAWRLPGYGEFLEQRDAGLRERMAASGAPRGFADVVATLNQIPDEQPEVPAHWSVTFAVDDADAVAAKAAELGGQVVVPPFDAPWVRMTVITDPNGARFTASKFVPENRHLAAEAHPTLSAA
jgi:predicted enzyme related to lactoylglutathione lyase